MTQRQDRLVVRTVRWDSGGFLWTHHSATKTLMRQDRSFEIRGCQLPSKSPQKVGSRMSELA